MISLDWGSRSFIRHWTGHWIHDKARTEWDRREELWKTKSCQSSRTRVSSRQCYGKKVREREPSPSRWSIDGWSKDRISPVLAPARRGRGDSGGPTLSPTQIEIHSTETNLTSSALLQSAVCRNQPVAPSDGRQGLGKKKGKKRGSELALPLKYTQSLTHSHMLTRSQDFSWAPLTPHSKRYCSPSTTSVAVIIEDLIWTRQDYNELHLRTSHGRIGESLFSPTCHFPASTADDAKYGPLPSRSWIHLRKPVASIYHSIRFLSIYLSICYGYINKIGRARAAIQRSSSASVRPCMLAEGRRTMWYVECTTNAAERGRAWILDSEWPSEASRPVGQHRAWHLHGSQEPFLRDSRLTVRSISIAMQ